MTIPASGTPEYDKAVEALRSLPREQLLAQKALLERQLLIDTARGDFCMDGYRAHFKLIEGRDLPPHIEEEVSPEIFAAYENDEGLAVEIFRGAAKTTAVTNGFGSYVIAKFPDRAGLLIQVGDESAADNGALIASIISDNPGWKSAYPHIIPDLVRGWGANGYHVKMTHTDATLQTSLSDGEWEQRAKLGRGKDPTLLAVGYKSRAIIGRRPFWLILDDIHDENNTMSDRELLKVKKILTDTIFQAANQAKITIYIGTPWNENDALHYCLQTGEFRHVKIPLLDDKGESVWPAMFDAAKIAKIRAKAGEIGFARMYLLDLSKTKGLTLKREWIGFFDNTAIKENWPTYIGVDYTSTEDPRRDTVDYFALGVGKVIPGTGKVVIEDGVRVRLTQADAEMTVVNWALQYPFLAELGIEAVFSGNEFHKIMLRGDLLKHGIAPTPLRGGPFGKSKGYRYEYIMGPAFQRKQVLLSDKESPFLTAFVDEWMNWQGDAMEKMYTNDTLDAVFNILWMAMPYLATKNAQAAEQATNPMYQTPADSNPFVSAWSKR